MKNMFPEVKSETDMPKEIVLCGLKINKVITVGWSHEVITKLECEDEHGEQHIIEFKHGVMVVDEGTVLVLSQNNF